MARTVNVADHAVRREAFVDAASRLILTKGYERMSIQDVLDDLGTSRGAFYHYFDSKESLLEAVVARMGDAVIGRLGSIVADADASAPRKLELVFAAIGQYKAERRDLVLAILDVWLSDDNALVRDKLRRFQVVRLAPVLADVIRQGAAEGTMAVADPDETATVVVTLTQGLNEVASQLFVDHHAGTATFETVTRTLDAYRVALERALGLPPDSLTLIDEATLRWWFEVPVKEDR